MNLKGYETTTRKVVIDVEPMDTIQALKAIVFTHLDIPADAYIEKGKLVVEHEYHGSHAWYETEVISENPTEKQLLALKTFSDLYDLVQKATAKNRS